MATAFKRVELSKNWQFRQADGDEQDNNSASGSGSGSDVDADAAWMPVASVPTNVHLDLLANGKIKDPYLDYNELSCDWVAERSWIYRTILPTIIDHDVKEEKKAISLVFEGLDTFATVRLNGNVIHESDNMYIPFRIDVTETYRRERDEKMVLEIVFDSAARRAREIKAAHPEHKWVGYNGDMARLAVRKAQYHWGWDWGPILNTCGPWRPVYLETHEARITDIRVEYKLIGDDLTDASGTISADITCSHNFGIVVVEFAVRKGQNVVLTESVNVNAESQFTTKVKFRIKKPELWYPYTMGHQPLYTVLATLRSSGKDLHTESRKIGFRKAELIQKPDKGGKSFYFRINNIDMFAGGSNWIPADCFIPRISKSKYHKWLKIVKEGGQSMIRVWGGGIWEEEIFYDLCDELGILVWQDFMFSCGNYPAYPEFLDSIEKEGRVNVRRLRHHPSIVLYAGNNEDYQVQESFGLTYDYKDKDPEKWLKTDFPARYIYERLLPDIVAHESPQTSYHPGSPWGDGYITSDMKVGDMHQWNVWHGTQEKYQLYDKLGGRFNSEFGMEALPHITTIRSFCSDESQLFPQSRLLDFHNKAAGHERRLATYLMENFRIVSDLEGYIHLTQLVQSEAMKNAYQGWRRQWGYDRFCGGALVWQLNDCWPGTSWAIVDYHQRRKPAYYAIKRALSPIVIGIKREHHDWSVDHARPPNTSRYEVWASSDASNITTTTTINAATIELRFISIATGNDIHPPIRKTDIHLTPNGTAEILQGTIDNVEDEAHVLAARLWMDGQLISRDTNFPQPLKYLDFSDRRVQINTAATDDDDDGDDTQHGESKTSMSSSHHDDNDDDDDDYYYYYDDNISTQNPPTPTLNPTLTLVITAAKPTKGLVFEERTGVTLSDSAIDIVPGDKQTIHVSGMRASDEPLAWRYLGSKLKE